MKAMILAAGLGTRLRPLTDTRPKALVEIGGRTLLELTIARLRTFGVTEIVVNVHHLADMVVDYLKKKGNFGLRIELSHEDDLLLDTGGGLNKAAWFFLESSKDEPFFLHNVDVVSTIDLGRMLRHHRDQGALATLAVQDRKTSRYLLFDEHLQLRGRRAGRGVPDEIVGASAGAPPKPSLGLGGLQPLAFSGIHVISPRLLPMINEEGVFSIIASYLDLSRRGEKILGFRADGSYWRDLGKPEDLKQAAEELKANALFKESARAGDDHLIP